MSKSYNNKNEIKSNKKNVRYYRVCGICGERHLQSQMIRDRKSHTGWICEDCFEDEESSYFNGFEDRFY